MQLDLILAYLMLSHVIYIFLEFKAQYNLSVESNQNVESKRQSVETKMGK